MNLEIGKGGPSLVRHDLNQLGASKMVCVVSSMPLLLVRVGFIT